MKKPRKWQKFIPSDIDLYPCYPGKQARVAMMKLSNGQWRVCIWGADDCGFDYDVDTFQQAQDEYQRLDRLREDPVKAKWPGWVRA
jgi:hypothetical protein